MTPTSSNHLSVTAQPNLRDLLTTACSSCGLVVNYVVMHLSDNESEVTGFDVYHYNTDLSFDVLIKLSERFLTRDINLSCEMGCESDRSHESCIEVKSIPPEAMRAS